MKITVLAGILLLLLLLGVLTGSRGAHINIRQHPQGENEMRDSSAQPHYDWFGQDSGSELIASPEVSTVAQEVFRPQHPGDADAESSGVLPPASSERLPEGRYRQVAGPAGLAGGIAGWAWAKRLRRRIWRG